MQNVNEALRRGRERATVARMAKELTQDRSDLEAAGQQIRAMGDVVQTSATQLQSAAQAIPGGGQILRTHVQPVLKRIDTARVGLVAPLRAIGDRVKDREACANIMPIGYKGGIKPEERQGKAFTMTPIFARLLFQAGALSLTFARTGITNGAEVFTRGRGESAQPYGEADGTTCTGHITNLLDKGRVKSKHVFSCYGVGFRAARVDGAAVTRADWETLGRGLVEWTEGDGKQVLEYPSIMQCPALHDLREAVAPEAAGTGAFVEGAPYIQDEPLFTLRNGDEGHAMRLTWEDDDAELGAATYLYVYLYGEHIQSVGNG